MRFFSSECEESVLLHGGRSKWRKITVISLLKTPLDCEELAEDVSRKKA